MAKQRLQHLNLSACGLTPANWATHYYPDDLPDEWKIAYYTNEFRQLFMPAGQWQGDELADWQEEISADFADFRFYVEITAEQVAKTDWPQTATQLGEINCAAVVRDAQLAEILKSVVKRIDLLVDGELLLQPLWQAEPEGLQLALLCSETDLSPLQLRDLFTEFQQNVPCTELVVFLDTPYQSAEKMRQMCELYGW